MPLTDAVERKALLTTIVPQLETWRGGSSFDWGKYFESHPEESSKLAYAIKHTKHGKRIWDANNVMARAMVRVRLGKPPKVSTKLDKHARKELLQKIISEAPRTGGRWGKIVQWKDYFRDHPEDAAALGYGTHGWNRNQAMANKLLKHSPSSRLKPYKVELPPADGLADGIKELEQKADIIAEMQRTAEVKELKAKVKDLEDRLTRLSREQTEAALIVLDLTMQLRQKA